jgi:hypothetical protein
MLVSWKISLIITFHWNKLILSKSSEPSKINGNRILSWLSNRIKSYAIFVYKDFIKRINPYFKKYSIIPCSVDLTLFNNLDNNQTRKRLDLDGETRYTSFSSSFGEVVKNV